MAIIISEDGKNAKRVEESQFGLEDKLQQYIYDNPDAIPLYDIDQDTRLFIAAREFSTKSGPIDALGFDASGNIYVVETKLYKNADKRTVVAQALDYGASLWRHAVDFDSFELSLDNHCQKQLSESFRTAYAEFFGLEDVTDSISAIKANLSDGRIKFVVLMDKLHDALKDLVVFVNQNSKFDLYAVELEYYKHKSFEIIIPKLYGTEVKKEVVSTKSGSSIQWETATEEEFWESVEERLNNTRINQHVMDSMKDLQTIFRRLIVDKMGGRITYHRKHLADGDVLGMHFEEANNKVAISMASDGFINYWRYKKSGPHVQFMDGLLKKLVESHLFDKSEGWLKGYDWYSTNLGKSNVSDEDIEKLIMLCEEQCQIVIG